MRVVFVSRFPHNIDQPRGGVETATVGLAKALQGAGVTDLHVVTLERDVSEATLEEHDGIKVHRLGRSKWPMILDVFGGPSTTRLRNYLRKLEPSVVHFHETWGFSAPKCGFPAVFTVHGFDSLNLPTERASFWRVRSRLWKIAELRGLRNQAQLISIAPYVRLELERKTSAKITDIWNSLDHQYFEIERKGDSKSLLFLGWLNQRKNPLVLIKAAAILLPKYPELKVYLCGEAIDSAYFHQLEVQIQQLGLESTVSFPGRLSQTIVKKYLSKTAMLVLPSFQENAPMVIAEAMAAGVPIVASNLCGIPDMIENNRSGILIDDPTNPSELASSIDLLLSSHDLRQEISRNAKLRAKKLFHPDTVAKATLEVYKNVINDYWRV